MPYLQPVPRPQVSFTCHIAPIQVGQVCPAQMDKDVSGCSVANVRSPLHFRMGGRCIFVLTEVQCKLGPRIKSVDGANDPIRLSEMGRFSGLRTRYDLEGISRLRRGG